MSVESFIDRFGGWTESYWFYDGEVELRYDPQAHVYLLVKGDELVPQSGVTSVVHIIDKSEALIPWACKQMAGMLREMTVVLPNDSRIVRGMEYQEFENLVLAAKKAHKEVLEDAGDVGHIAHAWIERYIKAVLAHGQDSLQVAEVLAKFPENERSTNCCHAALDWMRHHNVRWIGTERKIYSRLYGYAGTMDGLCIVDSCDDHHCCKDPFKDRLTISDWKTSNYLYPEYLLQTAAYMQAFNEERFATGGDPMVTDRWVIRLGKEDGEFQTWHAPVEDYDLDWGAFREALMLGRDMEQVRYRVKSREQATRESIRAERKAIRDAEEAAERARKAEERARAKQEREEALRLKCKGADKYKGTRRPTCGCVSCALRYQETLNRKAGIITDPARLLSAPKVEPWVPFDPGEWNNVSSRPRSD